MTGNVAYYTGGGLQPAMIPEEAKAQPVVLPGGVDYAAGTVLGLVPGTGTAVNEVHTLTVTGTPTGGSVAYTINGKTATIAYNSTAAAAQTAIAALDGIGTGNVTVTGGALPGTALVITFTGALAGKKLSTPTVVASLTGGTTPAASIAVTTAGKPANGYWVAYSSSASDGSQVARCILREACQTALDGSVTSLGGLLSQGPLHASAFFSGTFYTKDLAGIDSTAVTALGRIIAGVPATLTDASTILRLS